MSGLVESATAIMQMAGRNLDVISGNVANVATPGYKRRIGFARAIAGADRLPGQATSTRLEQGRLERTGNPGDLAIDGEGFFRVRAGEATLLTRQGRFHRAPDGALVTPQGYVLQGAGGGDLVVDRAGWSVADDGTILDDGAPLGRIALAQVASPDDLTPVGESFFSAPADRIADAEAGVRQGMLEASTVELGAEMTATMLALRQAETGARLMQTWDDLVGRAADTFGRSGR